MCRNALCKRSCSNAHKMVDAKFVEGGTSIHYLEEKLAKSVKSE